MAEIDFMSVLHKSTQKRLFGRVNDADYPKYKAAKIAKEFSKDYWDGDRRICYGGYRYIEGRWEKVARQLQININFHQNQKYRHWLWKGFLAIDFLKVIPDAEVYGIDISKYAIANCKPEIRDRLQEGNAINFMERRYI